MSAITLLSRDKQTFGEQAKNAASVPCLTSRSVWHAAAILCSQQ